VRICKLAWGYPHGRNCVTSRVTNYPQGISGFLYSTYATASFQATPAHPVRPPITGYLKQFCRAVVLVLVVLTGLAAYVSYSTSVNWQVWTIVPCFVLLAGFSTILAFKME
jgi:hypothetical protein